ncbi:MAG: cytochrome c biogenesis protein CcsA [Paludibacteraceae bacterium]
MLKKITFSLCGAILLVLVAATIVEQCYGTAVAVHYFYTSPVTLLLWAATVCCAVAYLFQRHLQKQLVTLLLHLSFVVILTGALTTHLFGRHGTLHLRLGTSATAFTVKDEGAQQFPFAVALDDFRLTYYAGTQSPMDFVSRLQIVDGGDTLCGIVSMNNVFTYRHYRFYQSTYDSDKQGATFAVSHDPYGIAITYGGYAMLLVCLLLFFAQKQTHFRQLLKRVAGLVALALLPALTVDASPRTLQPALAAKLGDLYVYYNERVCPLQTLANDFCVKIYGKNSYRDFTAEQVLAGWIFYYDEWKTEPMIKIKGDNVRCRLGIDGRYACLNDFVGEHGYKLADDIRLSTDKNIRAADEKFNLIAMVCTGSLIKIYPVPDTTTQSVVWYSWTDNLPADMPLANWQMIKGSMSYVAQHIAHGKNRAAADGIDKIRDYQQRAATTVNLPSDMRFAAEQCYNRLHLTKPLAIFCMLAGLLLFVWLCYSFCRHRPWPRWLRCVSLGVVLTVFAVLTALIVLRSVVSGHLPLSNGFETMQFLAWTGLLLTLLLCRRFVLALPFGLLLCAMSLMVSLMGESNPQVTNLMPVLSSPLLSVHVMIIMCAYALLAFMMLNGITALILYAFGKNAEAQITRLYLVSRLLLYPAIFCLTIGIFVGAVWANVSWGRYWGWDPKEVWALITMLVYAAALHTDSLPWFRRPLFFHLFAIIAFLCVLFTYFGVNFVLGGLHGYA